MYKDYPTFSFSFHDQLLLLLSSKCKCIMCSLFHTARPKLKTNNHPPSSVDGLIILTSFVLLIVEASSPAYSFLAVFRPIKFFRLLRLKRRYRDIMRTLVVLSYRLFSVGILLIVIYYSFAIIGMEFFHDTVKENCW